MKPTTIATFFIAICAVSTGAQSQNVYRCGNTYSQKPCADAVVVDVSDPRNQAQKDQADAETRRESAAANAMEKARLKEEAQLRADRTKLAQSQAKKHADSPHSTASRPVKAKPHATKEGTSKKKKEPQYFTTRAAAPQPKAPASNPR